ncbi:MAG: hypothetical protein ACXVAX_00295 [Pseudobdellovibrio sp.]
MDEFKFVLRCLAFAAALLILSQLKTKTGTIETDIQATLVSSKTSEIVNNVADGGTKVLRDGMAYLTNKYKQSSAKKDSASVAVQPVVNQVKETVKEAVAVVQNKTAASDKAAAQKIQEVKQVEDDSADSAEEPIEEIK